jgi:hypothetical protein
VRNRCKSTSSDISQTLGQRVDAGRIGPRKPLALIGSASASAAGGARDSPGRSTFDKET